MPFVEFDVKKHIKKRRKSDPEFKEAWDNSREEYKRLGKEKKRSNNKKRSQENKESAGR
jgi:hypothetical protein